MPAETVQPPCVLLVTVDDTAWEVLRVAAETLENFGLRWRSEQENTDAAGEQGAEQVCAIIVASPDERLPARWSARTGLPVIRVPVDGPGRTGLALLRDDETGGLPAGAGEGVFATMAIGAAGAKNAALFIMAALAATDNALRGKLAAFRLKQTDAVLAEPPPRLE